MRAAERGHDHEYTNGCFVEHRGPRVKDQKLEKRIPWPRGYGLPVAPFGLETMRIFAK
jgi:hypothetical protein